MGIKVLKNKGPKVVPTTGRAAQPQRRGPEYEILDRSHMPSQPTILSILIPTIPGREQKLNRLLRVLDRQVLLRPDVELIVLRDNKKMTIGEKRNKLLWLASGQYVAFVDDDDQVTPDYVPALCNAIASDRPDVVCFTVTVRGYGPTKPCHYHPTFPHSETKNEYKRKPNHLMAWRRDLARRVPFPEINAGEDTQWANKMAQHAKKVTTIDRPLYTYLFDKSDNSMLRPGVRRGRR